LDNILWVSGIVGLAAFVQSVAGFGFAMVAIALLPFFLDLDLAAPLVLTMCLLSSLSLCVYHREHLDWGAIAPLMISALVAIPLGLVGLNYLPDAIARKLLGSLIILYVAYDLLRLVMPALSPPQLKSSAWAYLFGGFSGFLTGAFTAGGPPLVIYANARDWSPEAFKGNLPAVYVVALTFALAGHYFEGHLTLELGKIALYSLPLFAVGMGVGIWLSKHIDAVSFKRIVLFVLGLIGLRLIW
jgi:uncharacterized protein